MNVLGIETSCDETSLALVEAQKTRFRVRRLIVSSQAAMHKRYGGVVPEVAARKHVETLPVLLDNAIGRKALNAVNLIAVTAGPGLITSLMVGVQAAKTLAMVLNKPLVAINHLEAHIYANWLTHPALATSARDHFPSVVLIVSGGHTLLVQMDGHGRYELLGQTVDDAAGEAFDKVANILQLGYPGGPAIARCAEQGRPDAIPFPRPMLRDKTYNLSFSGLKTAVLYFLKKQQRVRRKDVPDIAASFQQAVVDVLTSRVARACGAHTPRSLMLVGGVSANQLLRRAIKKIGTTYHIPVFIPELAYTGDNAAMIAAAGYFRRGEASRHAWKTLTFDPHLPLIS